MDDELVRELEPKALVDLEAFVLSNFRSAALFTVFATVGGGFTGASSASSDASPESWPAESSAALSVLNVTLVFLIGPRLPSSRTRI